MSLIEPEIALQRLLERLAPVETERVLLAASRGRVIAEPLCADRDSPPHDVSSMDGYAVRLADLANGEIPVAGGVLIGTPPLPLPPGEALRIVTGACLPTGAEAVIAVEDTAPAAGGLQLRPGVALPTPGQNIRRRGENLLAGGAVLETGTPLTAPRIGALAAFGSTRPLVFRRVRVALITSGDELVDATEAAEPWQIRDSNGPSLWGMLGALPWVELVAARRVGDTLEGLQAAVSELLERSDALLLTGAVSMGDRDFVPHALAGAGVTPVFHRVRQRPGKPLLGGVGPAGQAVLGLPGNPLSVLVTARCFAVPALRRLGGHVSATEPRALVRLQAPTRELADLWWHRLVALTGGGEARLIAGRGSGDLVAAAQSDGFVVLPPGQGGAGPWPYVPWTMTT